jgi:hypothetical protein
MSTINCYFNDSSLSDFFLNEDSNFGLILRKYGNIFWNGKQDEIKKILQNESNPFYWHFKNNGTKASMLKNFDNEIFNSSKITSNELLGYFFSSKPEDIEKFGIPGFISGTKYDDFFEELNFFEIFDKDDAITKNWDSIFKCADISIPPLNSLIINDPYLFDNVKIVNKESVNLGVLNIIPFLDQFLPQQLSIPFHITIFSKPLQSVEMTEKIFSDIKMALSKLRDFEVIIELVLINEPLHSRKMYSNTFQITLDKGFNLFSFNKSIHSKNEIRVEGSFLSVKSRKGKTVFESITSDISTI